VKFPEIYAFIDKISVLWNMPYVREKNEEALRRITIAANPGECCMKLKTKALQMAVAKHNIDYLFVAIRADEQEARKHAHYFAEHENHIRVHPLLDFTEADVWAYIKRLNLPYCSLYDKGYKSLGCAPCTKPAVGGPERGGRDSEKEKIMTELRKLGYF
jgi:phosphoadenosine phosphosulfate reductase